VWPLRGAIRSAQGLGKRRPGYSLRFPFFGVSPYYDVEYNETAKTRRKKKLENLKTGQNTLDTP